MTEDIQQGLDIKEELQYSEKIELPKARKLRRKVSKLTNEDIQQALDNLDSEEKGQYLKIRETLKELSDESNPLSLDDLKNTGAYNNPLFQEFINNHGTLNITNDRLKVKVKNKLAEMLAAATAKKQVDAGVGKILFNIAVKNGLADPESSIYKAGATDNRDHISICKFENGKTRRKLNYNIQGRKITIFKSNNLKLAFISSDLAYCTNEFDGLITLARINLSRRKKVQPLLQADDLCVEVLDEVIPIGNQLNDMKGQVYDQLKKEGWKMLCQRPTASYHRPK
nr:hypothetical protein [Moritella viscosa]SHO17731.1 Transcriptional regulator of sugar metabolism [Moritella viscosa]